MAWLFRARHAAKRSRNMSMVLALTSGRTSVTSVKASSVAGRTAARGRWKRSACRRGPAPPSEVAFASVVIQAAASRMRRAFTTLRKADESIEHDSNDQEPKLYE